MKFSELSNKDRYRIIRMGVQSGIHSVSDIEHIFDEGGHLYGDGTTKLGITFGDGFQQYTGMTPEEIKELSHQVAESQRREYLRQAQTDFDRNHIEWNEIDDSTNSIDIIKYAGKRPETLEDVAKTQKHIDDAKAFTKGALGVVTAPFAGGAIGATKAARYVAPIAKSMLAGMGADAVSELITGKSVAEHTKDAVQYATGLNPRNNTVSNFIFDTFGNPFYGFTNETARGFVNAGKRIHNNTSNTIKPISKKEIETAWQKAVDAGDMTEAQRLRDLHFGLSNSKYKEPLFRGTDENSPIMNLSKMQVNDVPAVYLTPYEKYAKQYGDNVRKLYLNTQNPWIDKLGKDYSRFSVEGVKKRLDKAIQKGDNDKIKKYREILNDIEGTDAAYRYRIDGANGDLTKIYEGTPTEILGKDVNKIKLADAVTYDDNGRIIPLSKRDNFNINDIRYGLIPIAGLEIYKLQNH